MYFLTVLQFPRNKTFIKKLLTFHQFLPKKVLVLTEITFFQSQGLILMKNVLKYQLLCLKRSSKHVFHCKAKNAASFWQC